MADRDAPGASQARTPGKGRGRGIRSRSKSIPREPGTGGTAGSMVSTIDSSSGIGTAPTLTTTTGAASTPIAAVAPKATPTAAVAPKPLAAAPPALTTAGVGRGRGIKPTEQSGAAARPPGDSSSNNGSTTTNGMTSDEEIVVFERPSFGRGGRPIKLRANCFTLKLHGALTVHQYRVDVLPDERGAKKLNRDENYLLFWQAVREQKWIDDPHTVLYDGGSICYTLNQIKACDTIKGLFYEFRSTLPRYMGKSDFKVIIKYIGEKPVTFDSRMEKQTATALYVTDLLYRQYYNLKGENEKLFYPNGRSMFNRPSSNDRTCFDLDAGRQVWSGYFFGSYIAVGFVPILNIDTATGIFFKAQPILQMLCDVMNQAAGAERYRLSDLNNLTQPYTLKPPEIRALSKALKGSFVCAQTAPNRHQRVDHITDKAADTLTFEFRDPKTGEERSVTVAQYFIERYNQPLRHPYFPCIQVGSKKRFAFLPLEICDIATPQRVRGKLTEQQTATMIRGVCMEAPERERRINDMIQKSGMLEDPFAKRFGVQLDPRMMQMEGRILNPPKLQYASTMASPRDGAWQGGALYQPMTINAYALISFVDNRDEPAIAKFCYMIMEEAKRMGMTIRNAQPTCVLYITKTSQVHDAVQHCMSECATKGLTCDLIIVPMMARWTDGYAMVKGVAEKTFGIITQCIQQKNIRKAQRLTAGNIVLKINAKLGGVNCRLAADQISEKYLINKPTLVIGLDVTHPGATERSMPSIGAACGNIDMHPARFGATVCIQKQRKEAVASASLVEAVCDRVSAYLTQVNMRPERIIFYRDGVAEGQFNEVMREEVKGVRMAMEKFDKGDPKRDPKITFVVVQKRHHVRFFCANPSDYSGKGKNIPAGTAVDTVITDARAFDFFLCSHHGIQGTSRPTRYTVLRDDSNFSADEMQMITYNLCHLYARCSRAVSYPAPTYYAHLACERARYHYLQIFGEDNDSDMGSSKSGGDGRPEATEENVKASIVITDNLLTKMYFC